jgi:HSP20 family protein
MFRFHPFSLFDLFEPLSTPVATSAPSPRFLGISQSSDQRSLLLRLETPGIKRDDISIEVEGDYLKIQVTAKTGNKDKKPETIYEKLIYLGGTKSSEGAYQLDLKNISATYENGLVEVTLPKVVPPKQPPRKINIISKL